MWRAAALSLALLAGSAQAQDSQTLADIRQDLSVLWVEIQRLNRELSTTGGAGGSGGGTTVLERVQAIEAELQRLTAKTEELEFRITSVVRDGTARVGNLELRLCELEAECNIRDLGDTPSLGGVEVEAAPAAQEQPQSQPQDTGPALAASEQADFQAAEDKLNTGDNHGAAELFAAFASTYPGGPLTDKAHFLRGRALENIGQNADAARAYLASFSGKPDGTEAPQALAGLGRMLAILGQTTEACTTLREVGIRFPQTVAATEANAEMARIGCS